MVCYRETFSEERTMSYGRYTKGQQDRQVIRDLAVLAIASAIGGGMYGQHVGRAESEKQTQQMLQVSKEGKTR
jgi:uncharacterized protein HemX